MNTISDLKNSFVIELLFEDEVKRPTSNAILRVAKEVFGDIEAVNRTSDLTSFSIKEYTAFKGDGKFEPVYLGMGKVVDFKQDSISEFERSQIWNVENSEELLSKCKYSIKIFDAGASGQIPQQRAIMLMQWLEIALSLFPTCKLVWVKSAGKLQILQAIKKFKQQGIGRFIFSMINIRFFNVPDSNEFIVDSMGLNGVGLSDVQFHFKGVNPNKVANLAYSLIWYLLSSEENIIRDGDTIDGMDDNGKMTNTVQWKCRYEDSIIEPLRSVLDIEMGKFAAGDRSE